MAPTPISVMGIDALDVPFREGTQSSKLVTAPVTIVFTGPRGCAANAGIPGVRTGPKKRAARSFGFAAFWRKIWLLLRVRHLL